MNCRSALTISALLLATSALVAPAAAATCESLAKTALPSATVDAAQAIPAGTYKAPDGKEYANMPAFCRVAVSAHPTADSDIKYEVWMPAQGWNGKFLGLGVGGFAGAPAFSAMIDGVRSGYASASTDSGHAGGGGEFAYKHPEKIVDFGYRAEHIMAQQGQQIVEAFYGKKSAHNYFSGCSGGGRQAMVELQRYPEDYDGIVMGDPAHNWTNHYVGAHLWLASAFFDKGPKNALPMSKSKIIGNATNAACDELDGLKDGILNDPRRCKFDVATLLCKSGQDENTCLTPGDLAIVQRYYKGPEEMTRPGYYPAFDPGAEGSNWGTMIAEQDYGGIHGRQGFPFFRFFVFDDPNWDFHSFKWGRAAVDEVDNRVVLPGQSLAQVLNATNPDLSKFKARGGKLIHYHGYNDPDIPGRNSINFFEAVVAEQGKAHGAAKALDETQSFYRLFMVPGMGHCSGGPGPNTFDMLPALDAWVDKGVAPASVPATKYTDAKRTSVEMTRPLCPFPQEARYKGTGDVKSAANFACVDGRTPIKSAQK